MRFQCKNCMTVVAIEDSEMGQPVACGNCGKVVVVPSERLGPGAVIGDFVIERSLGAGGLAIVYLAHQLSLDRPAALKILHQKFAQDPDFIQNFVHEARAAAQINHPNIVQAYAVGEEDSTYYFAMEYVQGNTLKNVLAHSGRFVVDQALRVVQEIAAALDFAWENKQLVHRDIKPDNIIVTGSRKVKLADLGLACIRDDILEDHSGEIYGTPQYVAPEQLLGCPADNRSDIYSLGATFFQLVVGQCPYTGKTPAETAYKHISEPLPSPRSLVPDLPEQVSQVIRIMLAKRPGHRYQSAAELVADLERVSNGEFPERCPLKAFEEPINIDNFEDEIEAVITPEQEAEIAKVKKRRKLSQQAQGWSSRGTAAKSGRIGMKKKDAGEARQPEPGTKPGSAGRSSAEHGVKQVQPAAENTVPETGTKPGEEAASQSASSGGAGSGPASRRPVKISGGSSRASSGGSGRRSYQSYYSRKKQKKEKANGGGGGRKLAAAIGILLLLAVGGGIFYLFQQTPPTEPRFDLNVEQTLQLEALEAELEELTGREALRALRSGLDEFENHPETVNYLESLAVPLVEEEARERRADRREREINDWRERSDQLITEAEAERERREEELRQQRLEEEGREAERRAAERREERVERLREEQQELREETIKLSREHQFRQARIEYAVMARSDEEEFSEWASNQRKMLEKAEAALNTFRNTGNELEGMRFVPPDEFRAAQISSVSRSFITAYYEEAVYEGGRKVGEERRTVRVAIDNLETGKTIDLIENAWWHQGGRDERELNLMIGCYLLARGEMFGEAESRLEQAGGQLAQALLEELEEVRRTVREMRGNQPD